MKEQQQQPEEPSGKQMMEIGPSALIIQPVKAVVNNLRGNYDLHGKTLITRHYSIMTLSAHGVIKVLRGLFNE